MALWAYSKDSLLQTRGRENQRETCKTLRVSAYVTLKERG